MMIYNSVYQPTNPSAGVLGTSMIDLTSTSFAQLFADATDYSSSTPYQKGDIVYNQNSLWVYVNTASSAGNPPPTLPTLFNAYWEFIGSQGNFTWLAYADSPTGFVPLTGVLITGTAGQFSCTSTTLVVGDIVSITGNLGGTGNIVGFTNKSGYKISATNGSTTFTLVKPDGSALTTIAGSTVGATLTRFTLTNFTTGESGTRAYMGVAANKLSATESTYPADYFWKKVIGDTGSAPIYAGINKASISVPTDVDGTNQTYVASSDTRVTVLEGNTTLEYDGVGTSPGTWALKVSGTTVGTGGVSGTVTSGTIVPGTLQADTQSYAIINAVSGMTTDTATIRYDISGKNASGIAFTTTVVQTFSKVKGGVIDIVAPNTPTGLALTSSTETLPGGNSIGKIKASWTANAETDLAHYQVEIKSVESDVGDVEWVSTKVTGTNYEWVATPGSYYMVRVLAVDKSNNKSGYDYLGSATSDSLPLSSVAIGSGGAFTCASSALSVGQPIYVKGTLTGTGIIPSYSDPETYYVKTTNGTTTFTLSSTPTGSAISTTAGTSTGLTFYKRLGYIKIAPDSTAPSLPSAATLTPTFRTVYLEWTNPTDTDLAYINIWSSPTSTGTYTKVASVPVSSNETLGNYSHTGLASGQTIFYKLESVDSSGNISAKTTASGTTTLKLVSQDIDTGIINSAAMYATSIKPVEIISGTTAPTTGNFEGRKVLLTGNGLQYLYTSGAWVPVTVDADTITVGQLQAGRIAAGAIGADEIASNVISTAKMLVVGSNLIPNSDFGTGSFSGWRANSTSSAQSIVSVTDVVNYTGPAGAPTANVAKYVYSGTAANVTAFASENAGSDPGAATDGIAVQPDEEYAVSIFAVRSSTYASTSFRVRAYFLLTDGTTSTSIIAIDAALTTSWAQYSGSFVVPANAIRCWIHVASNGMTAGVVYFSNLKVLKKNSSELIVDGAVKTNHMQSNTISGDVITGNSLHSDKIIASTLTADRIKIPATGGIDPGIQIGSTGVSLGTVNTQSADGAAVALNFNANNDRNNTTPTAPTISATGTAIDHTINTDGSVDISFEWVYTTSNVATAANNIDGFFIYIYSSTSSSAYTIGTTPALEQVMVVPSTIRAIVLPAVAANKYYTMGVQAYRAVDSDIDSTGVKKSTIVKSTFTGENPYRPSASVAFGGDITGTIQGTNATTVVSNSALGAQDPATRINANTTLINPGNIKIYGTGVLSDWINGSTSTEINGGAIAADTITANKVSVGMRGITTAGITFNAERNPATNIPTNVVSWTAGSLRHTTDDGSSLVRSLSAGSATSTGTIYLYWAKGPLAVTSFSVSSPTITLNYAALPSAPFQVGEKIIVAGFTGTNSGNANGTFTVASCTSTVITYVGSGTVTGIAGTPTVISEINTTSSSSVANRDNAVVLAIFRGTASPNASTVTDLTVNVGRTMIDGTSINTGTVNADVLAVDTGIVKRLFLGNPAVPRFTLNGNTYGGGEGLLTINDASLTPIVRMGYLTSGSVGFELRNSSNDVLVNASTPVTSIDNGQTGVNKCNVEYSEFNQSTLPALDYTTSTAGYSVALAGTGRNASIKGLRLTTASTGSAVCYTYLGATTSTYNVVLSPNTTYLLSSWVRNSVASTSGVLRIRLDDVGSDTVVKTFTTSSTALTWTRVSGTFTTNASTSAGIVRLGNLTDNSAMTFSGIMIEEARGVSPTPSPYVPPAITGQITSTNTSTYIASLRADVIQIDNTTIDTDGSGNLIIKSNGVDTLQIKNNAVTEIVSSFTAATVGIVLTTYSSIQTATITTIAATDKVDVISNFNATFISGTNSVINFRIKRGSTVIYTSYGWTPQYLSPAFSDTPGVGTFVYTLEAANVSAATQIDCSNRYLRLIRISK